MSSGVWEGVKCVGGEGRGEWGGWMWVGRGECGWGGVDVGGGSMSVLL